ncbi:hypothetical protein [Streptomyces sp. NPDC003863]
MATKLNGLVAPLVWLPYLGYSYHRATQELGERASRYYLGEASSPSDDTARAQPALMGAILTMLLSLVVPIGPVVLLVIADVRLAGSRYPAITITLIILSTAAGVAWYLRRRHRRRSEG